MIESQYALDTVEQIYMSYGDNETDEAIVLLNRYAEFYCNQKYDECNNKPLREGKTRGDVKPFTHSKKPNKQPNGQR